MHNLPYARALLAKAVGGRGRGPEGDRPRGDAAPAPRRRPPRRLEGRCTSLCHVGIEDAKGRPRARLPVPPRDPPDEGGARLLDVPRAKPHGAVTVRPADCAACHHPKAPRRSSARSATDVRRFKARAVVDVPSPHAGPRLRGVPHGIATRHGAGHEGRLPRVPRDATPGERSEEGLDDLDGWLASFTKPLDEVEAALGGLPPELAEEVLRDLAALRRAGPWHNIASRAPRRSA